KLTLDFEIRYRVTDCSDLVVIPILHFDIFAYTGLLKDFRCAAFTNSEDIGQSDNSSFVFRDVYPCYSCHNYPCLCLNLGFFLFTTYRRPFLRTIMHSALLFLTDALTFILNLLWALSFRL